MLQTLNKNERKFTPLVLEPRKRLIRLYCTPNKNRLGFTLAYYDESGRRQRRVYSDRSVAEKEAEKLRRKIDSGVLPGLLLNGQERLIYERALEIARATGLDLDFLAKEAAEARAILGAASLPDAARFYVEHKVKVVQKTVTDAVDELVADRAKNGKSTAYIRDLRIRLGNFARAFKCAISSIEPKDIEQYLDSIGAKGRYRKNLISSVGTLFNYCRGRNYIHRDHSGITALTAPAIVPREIRILTPAEARKLLLRLPGRMIPSAALALFAPLRTAEIDRLDWSRINLEEGHIEIVARSAKKKIRRIVPMTPNLKSWLRPFVKPSGKVCPYLNLGDNWNQVAARAGVRWSGNVHRDSAISYAVALTRNVHEVALISGNSPQIIQSNYLKAVTEAEARKWFSVRPPLGWKPKH